MAERLRGKAALVTGGGSGIGRAACLAFAREGARVVAADVREDAARGTAAAVREVGAEALAVRADVSRAGDAEAMVRTAMEAFGGLDCAHNNAGVEGRSARLPAVEEADFDRTIAVNLKGVFLGLKYEFPALQARGGGAIVNTASIFGLVGARGAAAYAASKHGVVGLTRVAALEGAPQGIRVNAVCPGHVATPMTERNKAALPAFEERSLAATPAARLGTADEVAAAVVWLCTDEARYVTGQALAVDGGWTAQ